MYGAEPLTAAFVGRHNGVSSQEETTDLLMSAKLPPSSDGRVSWFRYQDLVLKNRLVEDAAIYRNLLDNEKLIDPDNSVEYFPSFLRGFFLKGTQNVFLILFSHRRSNAEFVTFISRQRLQASWEDTAPGFTQTSPAYIQAINGANQRIRDQNTQRVAEVPAMPQGLPQAVAAPIAPAPTYLDAATPENFERFVQGKREEHAQAFPLSDSMLTCSSPYKLQSELSDGQRERLASSLILRGIQLLQYTYRPLRPIIITFSSFPEDPNIRHTEEADARSST